MTVVTQLMLDKLPYSHKAIAYENDYRFHGVELIFDGPLTEGEQADVNQWFGGCDIELSRLDWRDDRTLWIHDKMQPEGDEDEQLKDATLIISFVDNETRGAAFAVSKVFKIDLEGKTKDFIDYIAKFDGVVHMEQFGSHDNIKQG